VLLAWTVGARVGDNVTYFRVGIALLAWLGTFSVLITQLFASPNLPIPAIWTPVFTPFLPLLFFIIGRRCSAVVGLARAPNIAVREPARADVPRFRDAIIRWFVSMREWVHRVLQEVTASAASVWQKVERTADVWKRFQQSRPAKRPPRSEPPSYKPNGPISGIEPSDHEGRRAETPAAGRLAQTRQITFIQLIAMALNTGIRLRGQHGRMHGCVRATFEVLDNIPTKYKVGIFATPAIYQAVIRFSSGPQAKDTIPGTQGPAPPLPTDGDAVPSIFEVNGRSYPDTAILRNALPGPAFRAPGLSIPAGLTREGLPVGFEIAGLPGEDDQLLRLGLAIESLVGPLPAPTFLNG
jgi:hypothetical protein